MSSRRGLLIILSSPSGAGKSTLAKRLRAWDPTLSFSVSATTRKPRPGEEDGKDYHFTVKRLSNQRSPKAKCWSTLLFLVISTALPRVR